LKKIKITLLLLTLLLFMIVVSGCQAVIGMANQQSTDDQMKQFYFLAAINSNNLEWFMECVDGGADVNMIKGGFSINGVAIPSNANPAREIMLSANDNTGMLKYLLQHKADPNYTDIDGLSLLMLASGGSLGKTSHVTPSMDICKLLIDNGADVNKETKDGNTALDFAVKAGSIDVAELLLRSGCKISQKTLTALDAVKSFTTYNYNYGLANLIFKEANKQNIDLNTDAIFKAVIVGDSQTALELLNDKTPGSEYKEQTLFGAAAFCNGDVIEKLISKGLGEINAVDKGNRSLVQVAAEYGNLGNVKYLYSKNAPVQSQDYSEYTALDDAINNNHADVASYLFQQGLKLNLSDDKDFPWVYFSNPLDNAISAGNMQMVNLLISNGYPLNDTTISHAMQESVLSNQLDMLKFFLGKGIDINYVDGQKGKTLLETSCDSDNYDVAKYLLENGAKADGNGVSIPLFAAVKTGDVELVNLLISNKADPNALAKFSDGSQSDPIILTAVQKGYFEVVKALVESGADINAKYGKDVNTILYEAAGTSSNILSYLISKGMDIDYANANGITPLMQAVSSGNIKNAEFLVNSGAKKDTKNKAGETAYDIAKKANNKTLVELLSK